MEFKSWMKSITAEDMPNHDLRELAREHGIETALKVIDSWTGLTVSIPRFPYKTFFKNYVIKMCDGTRASIVKLTKECEVTDKFIYSALRDAKRKK